MRHRDLELNGGGFFHFIDIDFHFYHAIIHSNLKEMKDRHWFNGLSEEDLAFIKRFILASGSLKELAAGYGISYPTIRLRLDRLIEKIKVLDSFDVQGEFERALRSRFAEGKIDGDTFRVLLDTHKKELEDNHEKRSGDR